MKNNMIVTAIIVVLVGAGGFYGGMKYQQSKVGTFNQQFGTGAANGGRFARGAGGQGGARGNRAGMRPVMGEIISSDDKSITVKLQDGSSKIVMLTDTTNINKAEKSTKADLMTGTKVSVFGQEDTGGIVTAQNIQLNPMNMMPRGTVSPTK